MEYTPNLLNILGVVTGLATYDWIKSKYFSKRYKSHSYSSKDIQRIFERRIQDLPEIAGATFVVTLDDITCMLIKWDLQNWSYELVSYAKASNVCK